MATNLQCCIRAPLLGRLPTNVRHVDRMGACSVVSTPCIYNYTSIRHYTSMGEGWGFKKVQYTKYRITKPWTTDTEFDDLLLREPSRYITIGPISLSAACMRMTLNLSSWRFEILPAATRVQGCWLPGRRDISCVCLLCLVP